MLSVGLGLQIYAAHLILEGTTVLKLVFFSLNGMLRHSLEGEVCFFFAAYCGFLLELRALFKCLSCLLLPACPIDVGGNKFNSLPLHQQMYFDMI